jgi:hypothetical protein
MIAAKASGRALRGFSCLMRPSPASATVHIRRCPAPHVCAFLGYAGKSSHGVGELLASCLVTSNRGPRPPDHGPPSAPVHGWKMMLMVFIAILSRVDFGDARQQDEYGTGVE